VTDFYQRKKWYRKVKNRRDFQFGSWFVPFHLICFGFLIFSGYLFCLNKTHNIEKQKKEQKHEHHC